MIGLGAVIARFPTELYSLYVDDIHVYIVCSLSNLTTAITTLESCLIAILEWITCSQLIVNPSKSEVVVFHSSRLPATKLDGVSVRVGDSLIIPKSSIRLLGVILDSSSWNFLCKKNHRLAQLCLISKSKGSLLPSSLSLLVDSLALSLSAFRS